MEMQTALSTRVVIVGGGFAGLWATREKLFNRKSGFGAG